MKSITSIACLAGLVALVGTSAAAGGKATQAFSLRLDGKHLDLRSTQWHPGAVHITATATHGEQELSLLRFRTGYGYAQFVRDGRAADGHGARAAAALRRIMTQTLFLGGVDVFPGERASFAANLRSGTYYLGELNSRPLFRTIHVAGASSGPLETAGSTLDEYDFGFRIPGGTLPARGTITIHNSGRQPHRLNLEPVKPGTTRRQVGAYIRKTGGRPYAPPPAFARKGPELGTALVGPGQTIQFGYAVPAGTYALIGWQQDTETGKPQALDGMYAVARFR